MQEPIDPLVDVRRALKGLSLADKDLNAGLVVARISDVRACVNDLILDRNGSEPWLIDWLIKEQAEGSVLYAAAKINKIGNGSLDASPADPRSRAIIMHRFNDWVSQFLARLDEYEASGRRPEIVAPWTADAGVFPRAQ